MIISLIPLFLTAVVTPSVVAQTGHSNSVRMMSFSPDGTLAVSASDDKTAIVWDMRTGLQIRSVGGVGSRVASARLSPDGRRLAVGGPERTRVLEVSTGQEIVSFEKVGGADWTPDGRAILTWKGSELRLVEVPSGNVLRAWPTGSFVITARLSADGTRVLAVNERDIVLYDAVAGAKLKQLYASYYLFPTIRFSDDGKTAIVHRKLVDDDRASLELFDAESGALRRSYRRGKRPGDGCLSPDGNTFVYFGDYSVHGETLDLKETISITLDAGKREEPFSCAFSPDGRLLLVGTASRIVIYDVAHHTVIGSLGGALARTFGLSVSRDSRLVAVASGMHLRVWDIATASLVTAVAVPLHLISAALSPDGRYLVGGGSNYERATPTAAWLDRVTGEFTLINTGNEETAAVAFTPDGKSFVTANKSGALKLWDAATHRELRTLATEPRSLETVAISPDGKFLAVGRLMTGVGLYSLIDGRWLEAPASSGAFKTVAFSADSTRLVATTSFMEADRSVRLWNVPSGGAEVLRAHTSSVLSAAFSPDGRTLVSGGDDNKLLLWDLEKKGPPRALVGHEGAVDALTYTPDGKWILSAGGDVQLRVWDAATGQRVADFNSVREAPIVVTPDGYYMASRGALPAVGFRLGDRIFPFDQFDLALNRPDIVLSRLGYASTEAILARKRAYEKRLVKLGVQAADLDAPLPSLQLASEPPPRVSTEKTLRLKVVAEDPGISLERILVFVNDVPAFGSGGVALRALPADPPVERTAKKMKSKASAPSAPAHPEPPLLRVERELEIELGAGDNKIQLSALNARGLESLRLTYRVRHEASPPRRLFVAAIGVSRYKNAAFNLDYAAKDARDLATLLETSGAYADKHVLLALDEDVTRDGLEKIRQFFAAAGVDDEVVLFAAGHGLLDDKLDYYFGTHDVDFAKPAQRGIPYEGVAGLLDDTRARRKLLLMDTCNSGEVDKDEAVVASAPMVSVGTVKARGFARAKRTTALGNGEVARIQEELFADLRRGSGATVISSASGLEFALESETFKNGVFTYALISGVKSRDADRNHDGQFLASELRDYVIAKVRELTAGQQTPTVRMESLEHDFPVY